MEWIGSIAAQKRRARARAGSTSSPWTRGLVRESANSHQWTRIRTARMPSQAGRQVLRVRLPRGGQPLDRECQRVGRLGERQPEVAAVPAVQARGAARRDGNAVARGGM